MLEGRGGGIQRESCEGGRPPRLLFFLLLPLSEAMRSFCAMCSLGSRE